MGKKYKIMYFEWKMIERVTVNFTTDFSAILLSIYSDNCTFDFKIEVSFSSGLNVYRKYKQI